MSLSSQVYLYIDQCKLAGKMCSHNHGSLYQLSSIRISMLKLNVQGHI
jgi:hypothetical protein